MFLVAGVFLYAAVTKLLALTTGGGFDALDVDTVAGDLSSRIPGGWWTLAGVELLVAGALVPRRTRPAAALAAVMFLSAGIGFFVMEMRKPAPRGCGCGITTPTGSTRSEAVLDLAVSCARNAGLIACLLPGLQSIARSGSVRQTENAVDGAAERAPADSALC